MPRRDHESEQKQRKRDWQLANPTSHPVSAAWRASPGSFDKARTQADFGKDVALDADWMSASGRAPRRVWVICCYCETWFAKQPTDVAEAFHSRRPFSYVCGQAPCMSKLHSGKPQRPHLNGHGIESEEDFVAAIVRFYHAQNPPRLPDKRDFSRTNGAWPDWSTPQRKGWKRSFADYREVAQERLGLAPQRSTGFRPEWRGWERLVVMAAKEVLGARGYDLTSANSTVPRAGTGRARLRPDAYFVHPVTNHRIIVEAKYTVSAADPRVGAQVNAYLKMAHQVILVACNFDSSDPNSGHCFPSGVEVWRSDKLAAALRGLNHQPADAETWIAAIEAAPSLGEAFRSVAGLYTLEQCIAFVQFVRDTKGRTPKKTDFDKELHMSSGIPHGATLSHLGKQFAREAGNAHGLDGFAWLLEQAGMHSIRKFQNKDLDFCIRETIAALRRRGMTVRDIKYDLLKDSNAGWAPYSKWRSLLTKDQGSTLAEVRLLLAAHWDDL